MARFADTLLDEVTGAPIAGAKVYILAGGKTAPLTDDAGNQIRQPIITPQTGAYYFNASDAVYQMRAYVGARLKRERDLIVGSPPQFKGKDGASTGLVGVATSIDPTQTLPTGINGVRTSGYAAPGLGGADYALVPDTGQAADPFVRRFGNAVMQIAEQAPTLAQAGLSETASNNADTFGAASAFVGRTKRRLRGEAGRSYAMGSRAGTPSFGFGPRVTPGTSFDGRGVEFRNADAGHNTAKAMLAWGEPVAYARIINPSPTDPNVVGAGATQVYVDDVRMFAINDTIMPRLYANPQDTPESLCWTIAQVTGVYAVANLTDYSMGGSGVACPNGGLVSFDDFLPRTVTNAIYQASPDAGYMYDATPDYPGGIPYGSRYLYKLTPHNGQDVGGFSAVAPDDATWAMGLDTRNGRGNTILPLRARNTGAGAVVPQYQRGLLVGDITVDHSYAGFYDGGIGTRMAETDGIGMVLRTSTDKQGLGAESATHFHQVAWYDNDKSTVEGARIAMIAGGPGTGASAVSVGGMIRRGTGNGKLIDGDGGFIGHLFETLATSPYQTGIIGRTITGLHRMEIDGVVEVYSAAHAIVVDEVIWLDDGMDVLRFGPAGVISKVSVYTNAAAGDVGTCVVRNVDYTSKLATGQDVEMPIDGGGRVNGWAWVGRAAPLQIEVTTPSSKNLAGSGKFVRVRVIVVPDMRQASYAINPDRVLGNRNKPTGRLVLDAVTVAAGARSALITVPVATAAQGDFGVEVSTSVEDGLEVVGARAVNGGVTFALSNPTTASITRASGSVARVRVAK